jgi:competence protein ComEC
LVCRGLKLRRTHSAIVQLSSLLLYAMMAGARPSVVRAALVAGFYVFGELLSREFDLPSAIGAAALTLLAYEPGYLFDMGFQLSFATVITIVALMPLFEPPFARLRGLKLPFAAGTNRALVRFIVLSASLPALSIAAQIGSAPITAHYFNQISLFGVFANMIIVPLLWPTMGVGICVWLISLISWKAASCTAALALTPFLAVIVGTAGFFSLSPLAVVSVRSPGWFLISSYYVLLAWIIVSLRQRINRTFTGSP